MKQTLDLFKFLSVITFLTFPTLMYSTPTSIGVTKTCPAGGTCSVTGTYMFSLGSAQNITWTANLNGTATSGNKFYLSQIGPNMADILVATNLTQGSANSGTFFLNAGDYYISINTFLMGPGSYTVTFNSMPPAVTISLTSPVNTNFMTQPPGGAAVTHSFSLTKASGTLAVHISSITSSDATHFSVSAIPTTVPGSFDVSFHPGSTGGSFSSIITIAATAVGGTVNSPLTFTVTGVTSNPIPVAECSAGDCSTILGTADYTGGGYVDFIKKVHNGGTAPLSITTITLGVGSSEFTILSGAGAGTIAPGTDRAVSIRYTPTASEHSSCGSLITNSNDPAHPTITCTFAARAHHPQPKIRIEETTLNYGDVEIGFSFKKAFTIYNDGDADLHINLATISTSSADIMQWSSLQTGMLTVAPDTAPQLYVEIFQPTILSPAGTTYTVDFALNHDDPTTSTPINLSMTGRCIAPIPMDNVLVMDRSGSMSETLGGITDKIHDLRDAASLYLDLLRDETGSGTGDKLGFVKYNNTFDIYLNLDFKTPAFIANAQDKLSDASMTDITRLKPDGTTGIGAAMQQGASMVSGSPSNRKHIMILLTDGIENVPPYVSAVLGGIKSADPLLKIYSVGLGNDGEIDKSVLQEITNVTNGFHQVTDNLAGTSLFDLENFYFKIYSNANGMNLAIDPTKVVQINSTAPIEVSRAHVVSSDRSAAFLVLDDPQLRPFYDLELVDPTGQIMKLGSAISGIPIQYSERLNYKIYKIIFPDISNSVSYVGDWILRLTPNGTWNRDSVREISNKYLDSLYPGNINPLIGQAPIGFMAAVKSDYNMSVSAIPSQFQPGADVLLTVTLTDRGWPSKNGKVFVDITKPDHTIIPSIILQDDGLNGDAVAGDGVYTGHFLQTSEEGSYKFFFHAIGQNERGELVPREDTRQVGLYQAKTPNTTVGKARCIPCIVLWIFWFLVILLLLLLLLKRK